MPSREVVEIQVAPGDDANLAATKTTMITEGASPSAETTAQSLDESAGVNTSAGAADKPANFKGRKITPAPASDKKEGKNKVKQQRTLASFFTKSKVPPTPHAGAAANNTKTAKPKGATKKSNAGSVTTKDSKKPAAKDATAAKPQKKKPATKKASASANATATTPGTIATTPAALANSSAVLHNKMDFKNVIVGNLSSKCSIVVKPKPKSPTSATDDANLVDSLLPRIPPVSAVPPPVTSQQKERLATKKQKATPGTVSDKKITTTQDTSIKSTPLHDESESGSIEMGAVKSQLVHLFENPPTDAGTYNNAGVKAGPTKEADDEKKQANQTAPEAEKIEPTEQVEATEEDDDAPVQQADDKEEPVVEQEQGDETKEVVEIDAAEEADKVEQACEHEKASSTIQTEQADEEQDKAPAAEHGISSPSIATAETVPTTKAKVESPPETDVVKGPASSSSDAPMTTEQELDGESLKVGEVGEESAVASNDTTGGNSEEVTSKESTDLEDQPTVAVKSTAGSVGTDAQQGGPETTPGKPGENKVLVPITLGAIFVKKFGNLGYFVGKVTALPTKDDDFYAVFYEADGDKEQLTEKQLSRLLNTGPSKKKRKELEQGIGDPHRVGPAIKSPATTATTTIPTPTVKHFFGPGSASVKTGTKKTAVSKTKAAATPPAAPIVQLNAEMQALLTKHQDMKASHIKKAKRMLELGRNTLDTSGDVQVTLPSTENISISGDVTEFPDAAVPHLLVLLEGSKLPLSKLAQFACETLNKAFPDAKFPLDVVTAKTKVLSARKPTIKNPEIALGTSVSNIVAKDVDVFEDINPDHIWRWEVTTLDLLPEDNAKNAKLARSARRKINHPFNATARLLAALEESINLLEAPKTQPLKTKVDKVVSKISREEEKVLKFEQEAEKARLAAEVKKQKQDMKLQASKEEQEKKKAAELEKKKAVEQRKKEKEEAKQKKELEREETKRQKEEKARAEESKKMETEKKQKKRMMSFFGAGAAVKKSKKNNVTTTKEPTEEKGSSDLGSSKPAPKAQESVFDSERFWSSINSGSDDQVSKSEFSKLSKRATTSRRPKTKRLKMRVFVSGENANDPFAAQPAFAEERMVEIRNRNKFLKFAEDCRPAYHGTWSKMNKRLGRNPFLKDATLDYDVDSEAEWEEGDDDPGEDVENDGDDEDEKLLDEDEEGDTRVYNYQDGWLAQDDEIGEDVDVDDETRELYKARNKKREDGVDLVPVCMVAPADGGIPIVDENGNTDPKLYESKIEGFPVQDALELVRSHNGVTFVEYDIFLDAFPPALTEEREEAAEKSPPQSSEPTEEDLRVVARFVHHSTLLSKPVVIEELRNKHPNATASRAQAQRVLDSIAEKKRHSKIGVYWEVKQSMIDKLGLTGELKPMQLPEPEPPKTKEKNKTAKRKSSDASDKGTESKAKKAKPSSPAKESPKDKESAKKKKVKPVPVASAKLLQSFLIKKKK